jgi:UDP-GlcNAc:undecaprenyl-phosphate GlcNAc-1-phosphate transferase
MSIGAPFLALAFLLSVVAVEILRRLSPWLGLVDRPSARKVHTGLVPLCGGVAMFLAFSTIVALRTGQQPAPLLADLWLLVVVLGMLVGIGFWDDLRDIGPGKRLAVQTAAAMALLVGWSAQSGAPLVISFDGVAALPGWIALPVTLLFFVGLTNAFNMIDGLDGLAGGIGAIALAGTALAGLVTARPAVADGSLLLLAVVLGFLVFNMRSPWRARASVFMGDAGSMMLGGAVAGFIVSLSAVDMGAAAPARPPVLFPALLWLVALPVIDTVSLMVRRPLAGRSPMAADRAHLHHLLVDHGLSPVRATAALVAISALLGTVGLTGILLAWPAFWMGAGLAVPVLAHGAFVRFVAYRGRRRLAEPSLAAAPEAAE